ncbi:MAG: RNA pseudouridine synthase, partial [Euryarchaeota archaeon]|nr:RNA pseudouridine synthase [Euryarchaeota archaeon]
NNGKIDAPIGRDRKDHTKYTISESGKKSFTDYKVEKQFRHCSLVSFFPKTGRTHQIRVHASHVGHPIFGDEKYGGGIAKTKGFLPEITQFYKKSMSEFNRHALHAKSLEVVHPKSKANIIFKAPLPLEYLNLIESIESFYEG